MSTSNGNSALLVLYVFYKTGMTSNILDIASVLRKLIIISWIMCLIACSCIQYAILGFIMFIYYDGASISFDQTIQWLGVMPFTYTTYEGVSGTFFLQYQ